jgi:hypothetical protein
MKTMSFPNRLFKMIEKSNQERVYHEKGSAEWAWEMWCVFHEKIHIVGKPKPWYYSIYPGIILYRDHDCEYWLKHRIEFLESAKNYKWELEEDG